MLLKAAAAAGSLLSAGLLGFSIGDRRRIPDCLDDDAITKSRRHAAAASLPAPSNSLLPTPSVPGDRARQILQFSSPTDSGVKFFDDFVLAYDRRLRLPAWVFERLGPETRPSKTNGAVVDRAGFEFYEDLGQHPYFRSSNADYAGSGYDRGHMAAAGNHKTSKPACLQTFILSNICPQVGHGFNRHVWNSLERYIRSLTKHYSAVYVCTGPLFLPIQQAGSKRKFIHYEVLGNNSVAVPTHYFKVVLLETAQQQYELLSYLVPNMAHPVDPEPNLDLFLTPLDAIERAAGFLIFDRLPRDRIVRVNKRPTM